MIPSDRQIQKSKALESQLSQSTLDGAVQKIEKVVVAPYSDGNFAQAALEWLVCTDQV